MAAPGQWTLVNGARTDILNGVFVLSDTYKVALVTSASNISTSSTSFSAVTGEVASGNGYTTGGQPVTLTSTGSASVAVYFTANPAWTASGAGITARTAVLYEVGGRVLCYSLLDSAPADVTVTAGSTLTIRSDNTASNPVFTLA
jgi:hypothetical protein